ncbi:MAG: hypothetical protein DWQ34_16215 [Planctomycetota bacterium]|nr:MAG: hypothetical protein DWQ34_16215 [Planctomycetota bacterium]
MAGNWIASTVVKLEHCVELCGRLSLMLRIKGRVGAVLLIVFLIPTTTSFMTSGRTRGRSSGQR